MKIMLHLLVILLLFGASACGLSKSAVQTSVASTLIAMISSTPTSTHTPVPTSTLKDTPTPVPTNTPRPTPTKRPPTPTSGPKLSSYEIPVPFDMAYSFTLGDTQEFDFIVIDLKRGEEAYQLLYEENQFNPQAPEAMEWICAMLHVDYTKGPSGTTLDMDRYWVSTVSKGSILEIPFYMPFAPEFKISVLPKGMGEGWICGYLYQDDTNPMLVLGHTDTKPGWYFSLNK